MLLSAIISSIFSTSALRRGTTAPIPALLTSVVILESSFNFASTFARPTLLLRSATMGVMWRPVARARLVASALRGVSLRATRIRSYPRFTRRSAYTAPMPLEAPVTRAVPFDVELLISFSPVSSRVSLHFIWIIVIIHSPTSIRIVGLWLQTFLGAPCATPRLKRQKLVSASLLSHPSPFADRRPKRARRSQGLWRRQRVSVAAKGRQRRRDHHRHQPHG